MSCVNMRISKERESFVVAGLSEVLSSAIHHTTYRKLGMENGRQSVQHKFPLPILQYAGWNVKLNTIEIKKI